MYSKETNRITVKYLDGETKEVILEIKDRNWANVGELLSDQYTSMLLRDNIPEEDLPETVIALIQANYFLNI